eukprot:jgi/Galph1/32/GphlegSOOS_G4795.1
MSSFLSVRSVTIVKPFCVHIEERKLEHALNSDHVLIKTKFTAISAGTELLFYRGLVPETLETDILFARESVKYPMTYGYSSVGIVVDVGSELNKKEWLGRRVFSFSPHQSYVLKRYTEVILIPSDISFEDALFLPWMETAISLLHDGAPTVGEHAVIFGLGIVGLLLSAILRQYPLSGITVVEKLEMRRTICHSFANINRIFSPEDVERSKFFICKVDGESSVQADLTFEVSGNIEALNQAILCTGYDGRVVVGSWYGNKSVAIPALGCEFHRSHIRLIASQVSRIPPALSGRWDKHRRFQVAWNFIRQLQPSKLITLVAPLDEAPQIYENIDKDPGNNCQVIFSYS